MTSDGVWDCSHLSTIITIHGRGMAKGGRNAAYWEFCRAWELARLCMMGWRYMAVAIDGKNTFICT
jgi:hypothetical protein